MVVKASGVSISAASRAIVLVLMLTALLAGEASAQAQIGNCTTISMPGEYVLNTSIINIAISCIKITSSDVSFDGAGYIIAGLGRYSGMSGILVSNSTVALTNVTVKNVKVTDWYYGIAYVNVSNGSVANNTANSNYYGIQLFSSSNSNLNNNTANSNYYGIYLDSSSSNNVTNNYVSNNGDTGIYLSSSSNSNLNNNTANSNYYGIYLDTSSNNIMTNNNASSNAQYGIYLYLSDGNILSNSTASGPSQWYGIYLDSSSNNVLDRNKVTYNSGDGIYLASVWDPASSNNVTNNYVSNNGGTGIYLDSDDNTLIKGNAVSYNNGSGVYLSSSGYSDTVSNNNVSYNNQLIGDNAGLYFSDSSLNTVTGNRISNNPGYGVYLTFSYDNKIYDNLLNNTNNYFLSSSSNDWNTTKTNGTNIAGGPYLGGNLWAYPNGTGFSQTCADAVVGGMDVELDGICASSYTLDADNVDYLPLSITAKLTIPPIIVAPIAENTTNGSGLVDLAALGVPQAVIQQTGVTGYEYTVSTNGTTPTVNLSVDISIEPPAEAEDVSSISGAVSGFYYMIGVNDSSWFANVTNIQLKIYYNASTVSLPSGVSEDTLRLMRFTSGSWVRLDCSDLGGCTATLADGTELLDSGVVTSSVNATHPYVWANLSNFSVYGLGGSITPSPAAPAPTGTYKPQAVVLANSIDRALASDFIGFLRNQGIEIIEATAANFDSYKSRARFIIILGGPDAPEGVGDIVRGILAEDEHRFLKARGNRKMYVKNNIWRTGQVVRIIAGSGRTQTQEEWQANKEDVGRRIKYNLD